MKRFNTILMYSSMILLVGSIGLRLVIASNHRSGYPEEGARIYLEELVTQENRRFESSADTTIVIAYNNQCGTCQALAPSWKRIAEEIQQLDHIDIIGLSRSSSIEITSHKEAFSLPFDTLMDENGRFHREAGILQVPQIIWLHDNVVVKAIKGEIATDILVEQYLNTDNSNEYE